MVKFEWDPAKATANLRQHRVSFVEAGSVFYDPSGITIFDPRAFARGGQIHHYRGVVGWPHPDGGPYRSERTNPYHYCT